VQAQLLSLITPAIAFVFAVIFVTLWWRDRKQVHIAGYAICFSALTIGVLLTFAFLGRPSPVVALIVHFIYSTGVTALVWGLTGRAGQTMSLKGYGLIALFSAGFVFLGAINDNQTAQMVAENGTMGIFFALCAQILWRSAPRTLIDRVITLVMILIATQFFVRPMLVVLSQGEGPMSVEAYRSSVFYAFYVICVALLALVLSLALTASVYLDDLRAQKARLNTDGLTGLRMRRAFEVEAHAKFVDARGAGVPVSLILADVDHFKQVNDTHGHTIGDRVIAGFGRRIESLTRDCDVSGRLGGEEFALLVWNCDEDKAQRLADRVRQSLPGTQVRTENQEVRVTASFGVARWRSDEDYASVYKRADAALYRAKGEGRNRVCVCMGANNRRTDHAVSDRQQPAIRSDAPPRLAALQH